MRILAEELHTIGPGKVVPQPHLSQPRPYPGALGALCFALYRRPSRGGGPGTFSPTPGRPLATFSRPPWGLLGAVMGRFREFAQTGQQQKIARKVVDSHRIRTKTRQHGEQDTRHPISGSPAPGRARKFPKTAKTRFQENLESSGKPSKYLVFVPL